MLRITVLSVAALAATTTAQKADITTTAPQGPARYTIEIASKGTVETSMRRDGEDFGRGPSGPRDVDSSSRFVFDEKSDGGARWRTYVEAKASTMMPSRDGEPATREMTSSLVGQKLYIVEDDRGLVVLDGGPDGDELRGVGRNLPTEIELTGLTPAGEHEVGAEFALPSGFFAALTRITHPVVPQRRERGADGDDPERPAGGRGRGGQAGGRGGRGGQAGGGRDAMAEMRARMAPQVAVAELALLANDKLEGDVTAKLVSVEEGVARIDFEGERSATGNPAELGIGIGGMLGRRGGRGGSNLPQPEGEGTATVRYTGSIWVDTTHHTLKKLELTADHSSKADVEMEFREMVIESHNEGQGKVTVRVLVEPAPDDSQR